MKVPVVLSRNHPLALRQDHSRKQQSILPPQRQRHQHAMSLVLVRYLLWEDCACCLDLCWDRIITVNWTIAPTITVGDFGYVIDLTCVNLSMKVVRISTIHIKSSRSFKLSVTTLLPVIKAAMVQQLLAGISRQHFTTAAS